MKTFCRMTGDGSIYQELEIAEHGTEEAHKAEAFDNTVPSFYKALLKEYCENFSCKAGTQTCPSLVSPCHHASDSAKDTREDLKVMNSADDDKLVVLRVAMLVQGLPEDMLGATCAP